MMMMMMILTALLCSCFCCYHFPRRLPLSITLLRCKALFAKIYKIKVIFGNKKLQRMKVSFWDVAWPIFVLLILQGVIIIAWMAVNPLVWKRVVKTVDSYGHPLTSIGKCDVATSEPNGWAFLAPLVLVQLLVLVVGNVFAFKTRRVPTSFQEGKYIALCMVGNLEVLFIGGLTVIIVADNPQASLIIRSAMVFLNDFGVLMFIFSPKVLSLHLGWFGADSADQTTMGTSQTVENNANGLSSASIKPIDREP